MRFSVYTKTQEPLRERARHDASRALAALVVSALYAKAVGQNAIQLLTDEPWQVVKARVRTPRSRNLPVPVIKPPRPPENLMLWYPPKDYRTVSRDVWNERTA